MNIKKLTRYTALVSFFTIIGFFMHAMEKNIPNAMNNTDLTVKITPEDGRTLLKLLCGNKAVGELIYSDYPTHRFIRWLEIYDGFRRKGYGSYLMDYIEKPTCDPKLKYIKLTASDDDMIKFYEKKGYVLTHEYGAMKKALTSLH